MIMTSSTEQAELRFEQRRALDCRSLNCRSWRQSTSYRSWYVVSLIVVSVPGLHQIIRSTGIQTRHVENWSMTCITACGHVR
ncbi:hypothetical protein BJX99DRAFT_223141 [Aspergillus californicus]